MQTHSIVHQMFALKMKLIKKSLKLLIKSSSLKNSNKQIKLNKMNKISYWDLGIAYLCLSFLVI